MSEIAWFLEDPTPVRRYAATLLSETVGLRARFVDIPPDAGTAYVHHGRDPSAGVCVAIPNQPVSELPTAVTSTATPHGVRLSADVVDATVALVTDQVHAAAPASALDRHGRLRSDASHLGARGEAATPVVNRYANALADAIGAVASVEAAPRWPNGYRAAIGLSHDVDRPDKYAILRAAGSLRIPGPRRLPWFVARTIRDLGQRLRDRAPNDFWLFDEVVASEAALGMRSTFLFSVMPAYGRYGSTNDVLYDAAWPHLRAAMRGLRRDGIEIGLHASYHAHHDAGRFVEERGRLEELSRGPVVGLRHHFWQMGSDVARTLRAHESAGFAYDSSIAFNDAVGLRRGIALPYRPWDAAEARPLRTWQLPVIALDSAASAGARSVGEATDHLWQAIEGVIDVGGLATLDWHVRCSYPANDRYRAWAEIYQAIIARLAERPDVWTTGLGEIAEWAARREESLASAP